MIATLIAWAKSLMQKPADPEAVRRAYGGPNRRMLAAWIDQNMPDLDRELGPMSLEQVRTRLNKITGCDVPGWSSVESGSAVFLEALKKMKETS